MHLKHDFLQDDSLLGRPDLVSALEATLKPKNGHQSAPEEHHQVKTLTWEKDRVDTVISLLTKECETQQDKSTLAKDPLLYLLARLSVHYKNIGQDVNDTDFHFDTLEITSMAGRNCRIPLNNAKESLNGDPIVVLHMGKDRAANIIPKKLNISMLDVFDVQLGNFTVMTVFRNTRDAMLISLPREKTLEEDPLDLHIVLSAHCSGTKKLAKEPISASAVYSQGQNAGDTTSPTKYREKVLTDPNRPERLADAADPSNCPKEENGLSTSCHKEDSALVENAENTAVTVQSNACIDDEAVIPNRLNIAEAGHTKGKTAIDQNKKAGTHVKVMTPPESAGEFQRVQGEEDEDKNKMSVNDKVEANFDKDEDQRPAEADAATPTAKSTCQEELVTIKIDAREHDSGGVNQDGHKTDVTDGSDGAKLISDPVIVNSDVAEPISYNKNKVRKTKRFLSSEHCAGIVNGNNINFVTECLKICGLQGGEAADKNRAEVLEYIQTIKEGTTKAPKALIYLMVGKLSKQGVDLELERMKIQEGDVKKAKDRKQLVKSYLLTATKMLSRRKRRYYP